MDIFCINLKSVNYSQLKSICEKYSLHIDTLVELKSSGIEKIWIENFCIIAFTTKSNTEIQLTTTTTNDKVSRKKYKKLKSIQPVKTPKSKKSTDFENVLFLEFETTDINRNKIKQQLFLN